MRDNLVILTVVFDYNFNCGWRTMKTKAGVVNSTDVAWNCLFIFTFVLIHQTQKNLLFRTYHYTLQIQLATVTFNGRIAGKRKVGGKRA